jgi:toxin YoeB
MAKRIIWAPQAVADRIQILDYWYKRLGTKEYSQKLDEMFKEAVRLLSEFPFLGRQVKNREERFFVKDHYQIFYLNNKDHIRILHL